MIHQRRAVLPRSRSEMEQAARSCTPDTEPAGEAPRGFDMQPLAALPERACQMREMAGDLFFADSDACRKFTSRERPLSEHPPEFRPYRHVPLGKLLWGG